MLCFIISIQLSTLLGYGTPRTKITSAFTGFLVSKAQEACQKSHQVNGSCNILHRACRIIHQLKTIMVLIRNIALRRKCHHKERVGWFCEIHGVWHLRCIKIRAFCFPMFLLVFPLFLFTFFFTSWTCLNLQNTLMSLNHCHNTFL